MFQFNDMHRKYFYHYTNINSLKKIIETKSILFSNSFDSNDDSEIEYFKALCINNTKYNSIYSLLFVNLPAEGNNIVAYILSLCANSDNLTCWREYGDYGHGVCLRFDIEKLERLLGTTGVIHYSGEIIYKKNIQQQQLRMLDNKLIINTVESTSDNYKYAVSKALLFKHPINNVEKEYRITIIMSKDDATVINLDSISNFNKGNALSLYNIFDAIDEICLGPNVSLYEKKLIRDLLKIKNIKVKTKEKAFRIIKKARKAK